MNLVLVLALLSPMMQDKPGKVAKFAESLKDDDSKAKSKNQDDAHPKKPEDYHYKFNPGDDEDAELAGYLMGKFLEFTFTYPFIDRDLRFDAYPWANGPMYFRSPGPDVQPVAFQFDLTFGRVDHDLYSNGLRSVIRTASGFDLTIDISQYVEDLGASKDRFTLQEYQFNYGPGDGGRNFHWSIGWGLAWLSTDGFGDAGLSVQGKFICLLSRPFSFEISADVMGFSSTTINDLRAEFKYHVDRVAITLGIRSLINSRGDDLTGPTLGLSAYF